MIAFNKQQIIVNKLHNYVNKEYKVIVNKIPCQAQ